MEKDGKKEREKERCDGVRGGGSDGSAAAAAAATATAGAAAGAAAAGTVADAADCGGGGGGGGRGDGSGSAGGGGCHRGWKTTWQRGVEREREKDGIIRRRLRGFRVNEEDEEKGRVSEFELVPGRLRRSPSR